MGTLDRAAVFDLSGGADRRRSSLTRPKNRLLDVCNLLPRSPQGAKVVRGSEVAATDLPLGVTDILGATRPGGALALIARSGATYRDLLGAAIPAVTFNAGSALHHLAPYRGKIGVAQQGSRIQLLDLEAGTCEPLAESPKAGLCAEYKGMLWACGDLEDDDSSPAVTIPLVGVVIPPVQLAALKEGTADITYNAAASTSAVKDTSGASGVFTGLAGKVIILGGKGYRIASVSTTTVTDDTATVKAVSGEPDSAEGVAFQVLSGDPLAAYPSSLDLGDVYLFNDSGEADCRLFNLWTVPIRVTAVRPKGSEVKALNVPALPATIPPGGSFNFSVTFTPESDGECEASVVIEHDFYAQDSIVVPLTCTGSTREVLATPSVVQFGAWMAGSQSPYIAVQIQNPLSDAVVLKAGYWSSTGTPTNFSFESDLPAEDVTIEPGESYTLKVRFNPAAGVTGAVTGSVTFQRILPAKPFRVWRCRPGDPKTWDRDREWVDLSADGLAGGQIRALYAYNDALLAVKDASAWAIVPDYKGFRPIQLPLGEGVGTFGPQSVCIGGGALWFASKAGAYRLIGEDLKRISDPIEDLFQALTPAQFAQVRVGFYDNHFLVAFPAVPQLGASLWAYRPDYPDSEGSWWRLDIAPTALAVDRGATRKEALYGVVGTDLLHLDATEAAGVPWSVTTPLLAGQDPDVLKKVVGLSLEISETALVASVAMAASNGTKAAATLMVLQDGVSLGGVALYDGAGHLTVDPHAYADHALADAPIVVAGIASSIADNVGTTITLSAPLNGVPAMYVTFAVGRDSAATPLVKVRALFGEGAVASQFSLTVAGVTVADGRREVGGFSVDFEPLCLEGVAE